MFLETSQNSQENTCVRVSLLMKLQASGLKLYLKRDSGTGVFLWILRNFYRTPPVAASESRSEGYEIFREKEILEKLNSKEKICFDVISSLQINSFMTRPLSYRNQSIDFPSWKSWSTYFFEEGMIPLLSLNKLGEESRTTIILGNFVYKP